MGYKTIVEEYKDLILEDPLTATNLGVHNEDHIMPPWTEEQILKETKKAKEILSKLKNLEEELNHNEQIDLELMELGLKKIIFSNELRYNDLFDYEQSPNLGSRIIDALLYLFLKDPRDPKTRLDAINSRIKELPRAIEEYKSTLRKTIERWKDIEIEEVKGIADLFAGIISLAEENSYPGLKELKHNIGEANKKIESYLNHLNSLECLSDISIGEEKTQELVTLNGIDLTLEEIFNISKEFFKEHYQTISGLIARLKKKYSLPEENSQKEVLEFIKNKFSIPVEEVVERYKRDHEKILELVKKTGLFAFPKSEKVLILKTPSYLIPSIPVGAMFAPAPFEEGPKTSIVYLTIDDARKSDQNSLMITNTMIHEGIPGHHLQFAMAYENPSIVRKLARYNTHSEGWTTHMEKFMTKSGIIGEEALEEYELITLSEFARLGARVAIDLYFMTGDSKYLNVIEGFIPEGETNFQKAKSLLQKATGFTNTRSEGELNWYSQRRGYPMCYLLGNILVSRLQKEMLEKFEDQSVALNLFHKTYLEEGIMPLGKLRKIFEERGILDKEGD